MDKKLKHIISRMLLILPAILLIWTNYFELELVKILMTVYLICLTLIFNRQKTSHKTENHQ